MIEKICVNCGKIFSVEKYRENTAKFCSISCKSQFSNSGPKSHLWKGGNIKSICQQCGKTFSHTPNLPRIYCSKQCHDEQRMRRVVGICINCGISFERKKSHAKRFNREFCSTVCFIKYSIGENSPQWRGGDKNYPKTFNKAFKDKIRMRDNYTCAICKHYGNIVHHINYIKDDTIPENCITVCISCHAKTNSNRSAWIEYFKSINAC